MSTWTNPDVVVVTEEMAIRYADAKTKTSWVEGENTAGPAKIAPVRQAMDSLHRAWPSHSRTADKDFSNLLDKFDDAWKDR